MDEEQCIAQLRTFGTRLDTSIEQLQTNRALSTAAEKHQGQLALQQARNQEQLDELSEMVCGVRAYVESQKTKKPNLLPLSPISRRPRNGCVVCWKPTTRRCKRCRTVRYCDKECQEAAWQNHKADCNQMRYIKIK
jgi:hypothetical protein